jgi:hypothetical protein
VCVTLVCGAVGTILIHTRRKQQVESAAFNPFLPDYSASEDCMRIIRECAFS